MAIKESRREIAPGIELVVRGDGVEPTDAVLAHVLCEMAAEAGGRMEFSMDDPSTVEEIERRLRVTGVNPENGQWLN